MQSKSTPPKNHKSIFIHFVFIWMVSLLPFFTGCDETSSSSSTTTPQFSNTLSISSNTFKATIEATFLESKEGTKINFKGKNIHQGNAVPKTFTPPQSSGITTKAVSSNTGVFLTFGTESPREIL